MHQFYGNGSVDSVSRTVISYIFIQEGSTPLHIASSVEDSDNVIKFLIEDGAHVNAADNNGK